jgi:hypothetical protein
MTVTLYKSETEGLAIDIESFSTFDIIVLCLEYGLKTLKRYN